MKQALILIFLFCMCCHCTTLYAQPHPSTFKKSSKVSHNGITNPTAINQLHHTLTTQQLQQWQAEIRTSTWSRQQDWSLHHINKNLWIIWPKEIKHASHWPMYMVERNTKASKKVSQSSKGWNISTLIRIPLKDCQNKTCSHWKVKTRDLKICNRPLIVLQYHMSDAKVSRSHYIHLITQVENTWQSVLHHPIFEHYFANAHREASRSKVSILPTRTWSQSRVSSSSTAHASSLLHCHPLKMLSKQRARSFNLVDAPEREFAGVEEEESLWIYQSDTRKFIQQVDEDDMEIKIRDR